jgi:hypothetical protein
MKDKKFIGGKCKRTLGLNLGHCCRNRFMARKWPESEIPSTSLGRDRLVILVATIIKKKTKVHQMIEKSGAFIEVCMLEVTRDFYPTKVT